MAFKVVYVASACLLLVTLVANGQLDNELNRKTTDQALNPSSSDANLKPIQNQVNPENSNNNINNDQQLPDQQQFSPNRPPNGFRPTFGDLPPPPPPPAFGGLLPPMFENFLGGTPIFGRLLDSMRKQREFINNQFHNLENSATQNQEFSTFTRNGVTYTRTCITKRVDSPMNQIEGPSSTSTQKTPLNIPEDSVSTTTQIVPVDQNQAPINHHQMKL